MHAVDTAAVAWWIWPIALFAVTFLLGIVAVIAGIGGGILFVPVVAGFFPFHLDFVRGAGVLLALAGALTAGPRLLRDGLASLRLAVPLSLAASVFSILGAAASFAVPTRALESSLGVLILLIAALAWRARHDSHVPPHREDALARALGLHGTFVDHATGERVEWRAHRTVPGIVAFSLTGFVGGLYGLGAGWANVPALNLLMGVPLKLAAGTSGLVISIVNAPAAWVYFHAGAVLPVIAIPSLIGVMLGARIGVHLLRAMPAVQVRRIVILLLAVAGTRAFLKGIGVWA